MDISCSNNISVSEALSSFYEVHSDPLECANIDNGVRYINDLGSDFTEMLKIQLEEKLMSVTILSPDGNDNGIVLKEDARKDSCGTELAKLTSEKCLAKCATFPCGKGKSILPAETSEGELGTTNDLTAEHAMLSGDGQSSNSPYPRSISLPTPLKLISAMKGSREKLGAPPRKLSVKWAPDVYDPLPTAVSHVPSNRPQRHRSDKKNGKNKQKGSGKASRGNKGKDKKQSRKYAGSSNRCFKSLDNLDKVACSSEPRASAVDFDVGNPDPFCGHSFLRKSVTQLHFPVAEAT